MSERKWTDEQLSAIQTRDRTLLVSAAAGSGKTATLTERIIRSLTDAENPVDIDTLLIVTFTNAAAAELRHKLSAALTDAVAKNPENKRLERQLFMLPAARIRTIDSFCSEVLRSYCERVGVPPNYRIADTAECELLASSIADGLIEAVYCAELPEVASPEEFAALADCLTDSGRSDELSEVFRFLRARCDASVLGVGALAELIELYNPEKYTAAEDTRFGEYVMERVREMARHYKSVCESYHREFSSGAPEEEKYLGMVAADAQIFSALASAKSYAEMRAGIINFEFMRRPSVSKGKTFRMDDYAELRDRMKKDVKAYSEYFAYTDAQIGELFSELYRLHTTLYKFLAFFDSRFLEEKRRRGALSYADVERYAYKCLVGEDGEPTDAAISLRERFSAIYIDEYQDVNSLQNSIFEAISREDNRFMVGDIKQSIYGFREARPEIFAAMKSSLPTLPESHKGGGAAIFMSKNFRCDKGIVDFVNEIFDRAFGLMGESIGYTDGDRLGYAKLHDTEPEYCSPEIYMLDKPETDDNGDDINPRTPDAVAEKICELLSGATLDSGAPVRPGDIAIILRNASGKDHLYADALTARGVPVKISGAKDFFLSSEVLLALALLNAIDNPHRDIYLAAAMCSPLFGFTADELYRIRKGGEGETLYEALRSYTEAHPEFSRGSSFLARLGYYRAISEGIGVDSLIYKLYHETGLLALAAKSGGKDNLMLLYDYSRTYESGAFRGLYNFISFINGVIDKKTAFDEKRESDSRDAVSIVTAHASKGLEYPIVFFAEAGARYTNRDKRNRLVYSDGFGIAFRTRTPSGLAVVNNPAVDIINHRIYRKMYEEELRVLYVALTRARERLFVYGASPVDDREAYLAGVRLRRETLSEYSVRTLDSSLDVILTLTGRDPILPALYADGVGGFVSAREIDRKNAKGADADSVAAAGAFDKGGIAPALNTCGGDFEKDSLTDAQAADAAELSRRFSYEYPKAYLCELPEKMSVSKTSPTVLDGSDGEDYFTTESAERRAPAFIEGRAAEESAKRGIATHYVLQFCDLERLAKEGAQSELRRLLDKGFLSATDGERVRVEEIERFRESRLFADMRGARRLYRELRFNLKMPASHFTAEEQRRASLEGESLLVQGVIDCIVEYPDGTLGLFDYKTDRLTKEELSDRALAEEKLRTAHKTQLTFYAEAVKQIFGKEPARVAVYSLPLGDIVSMI